MVKNYQAHILLLWTLAVLTTALPQRIVEKVATYDQSADPARPINQPFFEFKDGGVKVNFLGFHAGVGLGGLLGGPEATGLHVSAGTPWGPSAAAGLGGGLNGKDGSARGGLYARAGLGDGRPEASAGLGGAVDGSERSGGRASGGLHAEASAGGPKAAAGLHGSVDGSGAPGSNRGVLYAGSSNGHNSKVSVKDFSNVQPIPRTGDTDHTNLDGNREGLTGLEFDLSTANIKQFGKRGQKYEPNGVNGDAQEIPHLSRPARRHYRKQYRNSPIRKQVYKFITTNTGPEVPVASPAAHVESEIAASKTHENSTTAAAVSANVSPNVSHGIAAKTKRTTLFDDIFNIPISTLTAVNQLLNNKSG